MLSRSMLCAALLAALLTLTACGSSKHASASSRLTPAQYRQQLHLISQQESRAQARVQKAFHATSVSQLTGMLKGFATDQQAVATKLATLHPPTNAQSANRSLSKAFADNAQALQGVIGKLGSAKTPKQALGIIGRAKGAQQAGHEIDTALEQLVKLGYAKGS